MTLCARILDARNESRRCISVTDCQKGKRTGNESMICEISGAKSNTQRSNGGECNPLPPIHG